MAERRRQCGGSFMAAFHYTFIRIFALIIKSGFGAYSSQNERSTLVISPGAWRHLSWSDPLTQNPSNLLHLTTASLGPNSLRLPPFVKAHPICPLRSPAADSGFSACLDDSVDFVSLIHRFLLVLLRFTTVLGTSLSPLLTPKP